MLICAVMVQYVRIILALFFSNLHNIIKDILAYSVYP